MRWPSVHLFECVILNTSSLSSVVRTQSFDFLHICFRYIYIPRAVRDEFSNAFILPRGMIVRTLTSSQEDRARALGLGKGESEAIILAMDMQAPLIMDDTPARKVAERFNVTVIGSVGIIRIAFIECIVERDNYDLLITTFEHNGRANAEVIAWARNARKPFSGIK